MRRSARLQEKKTRLAELHLQVTRGRDDTKRGAQKSKLYTIGHSTRAGDKFVELLQAHGIALLAGLRWRFLMLYILTLAQISEQHLARGDILSSIRQRFQANFLALASNIFT